SKPWPLARRPAPGPAGPAPPSAGRPLALGATPPLPLARRTGTTGRRPTVFPGVVDEPLEPANEGPQRPNAHLDHRRSDPRANRRYPVMSRPNPAPNQEAFLAHIRALLAGGGQ